MTNGRPIRCRMGMQTRRSSVQALGRLFRTSRLLRVMIAVGLGRTLACTCFRPDSDLRRNPIQDRMMPIQILRMRWGRGWL